MNTVQSGGGGANNSGGDGYGGKKTGVDKSANKELVAASPSQRNWLGILIALLVITFVLGLIACAVLILSPSNTFTRAKGRKLEIKDIIGHGPPLVPEGFNGSWISEDEFVFRDINSGLTIFNVRSLAFSVFVTNSTLKQITIEGFSVSPNKRFVLLVHDIRKVFRYSREARYTLYDVEAKNYAPLTAWSLPLEEINRREQPHLQHAEWTGKDDAIVFVSENNIYFKPQSSLNRVIQITNDGKVGEIYNGLPDRLYEVELLKSSKALWLDKSGNMLVFARFNNSLVDEYRFPIYERENDRELLPNIHLNTVTLPNTNVEHQTRTSGAGAGGRISGQQQQQNKNHHQGRLRPAHVATEATTSSPITSLRHAKPGCINPTVSLYVVNLTNPNSISTKQMIPPTLLENTNHYVVGVSWLDDSKHVSVVWTNRRQNQTVISICSSTNWYCKDVKIFWPRRPSSWLDTFPAPIFSKDGSSYLIILPAIEGEFGEFRHIAQVDVASRQVLMLTNGQMEVTSIVCWDENEHYIYYIGTRALQPGQRQLYRVGDRTTISKTGYSCLTCNIDNNPPSPRPPTQFTDDESNSDGKVAGRGEGSEGGDPVRGVNGGQGCLYNSVMFSSNYKHFIRNCDGPGVPSTALFKMKSPIIERSFLYDEQPKVMSSIYKQDKEPIFSKETQQLSKVRKKEKTDILQFSTDESTTDDATTGSGHQQQNLEFVMMLDNNSQIQDSILSLAMPQVQLYKVEIKKGVFCRVRLYLPPNFREKEDMRFPVVLQVNGAPGSQLVNQKWQIHWGMYLSSKRNFIYAQIDGRGAGYQGEQIRHEIDGKLGQVEVEDQIAVIKYLRDNLPFMDGDKMAVWGWGYGGFVSGMILAKDRTVFKCGISVAPISSWINHDSAFVERYLGLPDRDENYEVYELSDLTRKSLLFKDKKFLLVHGTADAEVLFTHTMLLSKQLIRNGINFKQQIYPDEGHSLKGVEHHLYMVMENFLDDCFGPVNFDEWELQSFYGISH